MNDTIYHVLALFSMIVASQIYIALQQNSFKSYNEYDFCHVNDFNHSDITYGELDIIELENLTSKMFHKFMDLGQPFVVSGVTNGWRANQKWESGYFE